MTDIFDDLSKLQAPETELLQTSKSTTVEIRKPKRDEWFRVSTDHKPITFYVYNEDKRDNPKTYLILPNVAKDNTIRGVAKARIIYVVINRDNEVFLSPVGIGDDSYSASSRVGHQQGMKNWVRLATDMTQKAYMLHNAEFTEKPEFPTTPYNDLLRAAFGQNVIDSLTHPVALELLGKSAA